MHRVSAVNAAKEPRISLVLSLTTDSTDAYENDKTKIIPAYKVPKNIESWELARYTAWRTRGHLDFLINESDPNKMSPKDYADFLDLTAAKLKKAANVIRGSDNDYMSFITTNSTQGVSSLKPDL